MPAVFSQISVQDCSKFADWKLSECQKIFSDSSLNQAEKESLYINLAEPQEKLPNHDFIWQWNASINFTNAPYGIQQQENGIIKNAWLKIIAVNKSVFDSNSGRWYAQPSGKILTAYNFSIRIPSGTQAGDCATGYSYTMLDNLLDIFLDGSKIGSGKIAPYNSGAKNNNALDFSAGLRLKARLYVAHYRMKSYCQYNYWEEGWCPEQYTYQNCEYYSTGTADYGLNLNDSFGAIAKVYAFSIKNNFLDGNAFREYHLRLDSAEKINELQLQINDNNFSYSELEYDLNSMLPPYNVLYATRQEKTAVSFGKFTDMNSNIAEKTFLLGLDDADSCSLAVMTDFEKFGINNCLNKARKTFLKLQADKNSYDFNEAIKINGILSDENGLGLGNETIKLFSGSAKNEIVTDAEGKFYSEIPANETSGVIVAEFNPLFDYSPSNSILRFGLSNSRDFGTAQSAGIFYGIYYAVFLILKKCFGCL